MGCQSKENARETDEKLSVFYLEKNYAQMVPILERLVEQDLGKVQLWKYRDYFRNLPEEYVRNSPAICCGLSLLGVLAGNVKEAEKYFDQLKEKQYVLRMKTPEYKEVENYIHCMEVVLPYRNSSCVYGTLKTLTWQQQKGKIRLSLTANRPSIINGGCDFSDYIKYIPKIRGVLKGLAKSLFGSQSVGMVDVAMAEILYQQNKLYEALVLIVSATPFIEREGDISVLFAAMFMQFNILLANKQIASTAPMLATMREKILAAEADFLLPNLNALTAWASMYDGSYDCVSSWMNHDAPDEYGEFCTLDRFQYFVKLRGYLLYGKHLSAVGLSERLRPVLVDFHRTMELCELDMLMAMSYHNEGDKEKAFQLLEASTTTARKYGFDRLFADEGEQMNLLLREYAEEKGTSAYLKRLIGLTYTTALNFPNYLRKRQDRIEKLTKNEEVVLKLMAAGRSNGEIATFMGITINTVKYHSKNLYGKLGVKSRTQAVSVAREIGLL